MRTSVIAVVALALSTAFVVSSQAQSGSLEVFGSKTITRIGVVVPDVAKAARTFADVFGVPVSAEKDVKPTGFPADYTGDRSAYTRVAEVQFDNMIVELAQPMGGPSPWRDFLGTRGQAIHHVAFNVPGVDSHVRFLESMGGKRVVGEPGSDAAIVDLTSQLGISFALHEGEATPSYIVKRRPDARASGGLTVVARLGLLGLDTDSRRTTFNTIFGTSVPEPVDERGLTFPEGFTGDPQSGMRHIFVPFDNLWINVIQPLGGESPWRNMVGNNQHYLFFAVEDGGAVAEMLEEHGGTRTLGTAGGGVAYMDMQDQLGFTIFLLPAGVLPE
jgi:catechol 2,3-dioxygenase-like lactoylglutathione lyase family enzyme